MVVRRSFQLRRWQLTGGMTLEYLDSRAVGRYVRASMPTKKTTTALSRRRGHLAAGSIGEDVSLGRRLQEFRRSRGLLQDELGRKLGLLQRIVSRIETGARQIQADELARFKQV